MIDLKKHGKSTLAEIKWLRLHNSQRKHILDGELYEFMRCFSCTRVCMNGIDPYDGVLFPIMDVIYNVQGNIVSSNVYKQDAMPDDWYSRMWEQRMAFLEDEKAECTRFKMAWLATDEHADDCFFA